MITDIMKGEAQHRISGIAWRTVASNEMVTVKFYKGSTTNQSEFEWCHQTRKLNALNESQTHTVRITESQAKELLKNIKE